MRISEAYKKSLALGIPLLAGAAGDAAPAPTKASKAAKEPKDTAA